MRHALFPLTLALAVGCAGATPKPPEDVRCATAVAKDQQRLAIPLDEEDTPVPITKADPTWGSRNALVTVVEFSDFQCPFCARANVTMSRLKETYGPDRLRVVWKNEPLSFHDYARAAAEFSQGVFALGGNDVFWKWHDTAFREQNALGLTSFRGWAQAAGVDGKSVADGVSSKVWAAKVDADHALAEKIGVHGTPAFFINGVHLSGAQPFDKFTAIIDAELVKAEALITKGTPRDRLYVLATSTNFKNQAQDEDDEDPKEDTTTAFKIPIGASPVLGSPTAQITIVEFGDFECPYTRRSEATLRELRAKYPGKIRLVWKDGPMPFHRRAEPAAELAREARAQKGNDAFWAAHDKLLESKELGDDGLARIAGELGLNIAKTTAALAARAHKRGIGDDGDVADDFSAAGTPHFFVNGRRLIGAQSTAKFVAIIDDEISATDELLKAGVLPAKVYEARLKNAKDATRDTTAPETRTVALDPKAPFKGNATAKIVIQEFSDFQCPYCQRVEDTLAEVMKEYGPQVKLVWRNMPLPMHPNASPAAQAAMEAYAQRGNAGFWKMHDLLFANQTELARPALDGYAATMKLDLSKWKTALDGETHRVAVDADAAVATEAGIHGTPSFLINGYFINGAQPYRTFRRLIERALSDTAHR